MKGLKKQLYTAIVMTLVAAIALSTATYAWFVNNASVEVAQIDMTASAAKSLEIAQVTIDEDTTAATVDALNALTYSGIVTPTFANAKLIPSSIAPANLTYNTVRLYKDDEWNLATRVANKFVFETPKFAALGQIDGSVAAVKLSFRSSENMKVYLQADTDWKNIITQSAKPGSTTAERDEIAKAIRIAFVAKGETPVIFAPSADALIQKRNTTDYPTMTAAEVFDKAGTPVVSVPSSYEGYAVKSAASVESETVGTAIATVQEQGAVAFTNYTFFGAMPQDGYLTTNIPTNELFKLDANVPKVVTVYVWLEGTDYDCVNAITENLFGLKLDFIGGPAV